MSFNANAGRNEYTAGAGQTSFPFNFKIFEDTDMVVYLTPAGSTPNDTTDVLMLTSDYTVTISGDTGGTITLTSGATIGDMVTLIRVLPITRYIEFQNNGDLLASTLNLDQDYQAYLIADKEANNSRFIRIPDSSQGVNTELPDVQPDSYLVWNSAGNALVNDSTVPESVAISQANKEAAQLAQTGAEAAEINALGHVTASQLKAWESEAERLTSESYATEAEDVPVNIVTSDGDGTFTYTPTSPAEYSALHHSAKSSAYATSIDPTTTLHTVGNGGGNPEGYTTAEVDAAVQSAQMQLGTAVTASSTAVDFTGIPSGVKRINVMFDGVSTTGNSDVIVQIGGTGGIETTGYLGASQVLSSSALFTTGFCLYFGTLDTALSVRHGELTASLVEGTKYSGNYNASLSNDNGNSFGAYTKTLASELTTVRFTTLTGTDTFNAGTINISWEF